MARGFMGIWKAAENAKRELPPEDDRLLHRTKGDSNRVYGIAFSPDGKWVFTCGSDGLQQWDVATFELVHSQTFDFAGWGRPNPVFSIAVDHHKPLVYFGTFAQDVQIWDFGSREIFGSIPTPERWSHSVPALAISLDGKSLAIAESGGQENQQVALNDFSIPVWDFEASKIRYRLVGHGHSVRCLAFLPGDQYLFSDGNSVIWSLDDGRLFKHDGELDLEQNFRGIEEPWRRVALFHSAPSFEIHKYVGSSSFSSAFVEWLRKQELIEKCDYAVVADRVSNRALIIDGASGELLASYAQFGNGMPVTTVAVAPESKVVVTGGNGHAMRGGLGNNDDQSDRNLCWWRLPV